jgi:hypothetical protein
MKKFFCLLLMLVSVSTSFSTAIAQPIDSIKGTWVLDTSATEESLLRLKPFGGKAFFFGMQYLIGYFYEVSEDGLLVGILPKNGGEKELRRTTGENPKGIYFTDDVERSIFQNLTLTLTNSNEKNMRIESKHVPELGHLLWKRVILEPKKTTPKDFQPDTQKIIDMLMRLHASD